MENLVKISYLPFHVSPGYTNHYGVECFGSNINAFDDFYEAKHACDRNPSCGCFDSPGCGTNSPYTTHSGFKISENGDTAGFCAWVRI